MISFKFPWRSILFYVKFGIDFVVKKMTHVFNENDDHW